MDAKVDTTGVGGVPDGGWGWVVVAAVAFINMTNQSIPSVFGLLFGAQLKNMAQETFTAALITNMNSLALNFSGLIIGPAIKSFKPRNVTVAGCIFVSFGMLICSFSTACWHFIVGYSLFVGLGLGLLSPGTFMAINSYFSSKRGRAVGFALAGTSLGQTILPHLLLVFLQHHSFQAAVLATALISFTGIFGALLLKPPTPHVVTQNNRMYVKPLLETENEKSEKLQIQIVKQLEAAQKETTAPPASPQLQKSTRSKLCHKVCHRLVESMDLELLRDPVFLSIIIGMGLVYTTSINFTMLFPSFLQYSVGLSSHSTATCMSIVAGADITCRLLLPCITDKLKIPYRVIFLMGTAGILISRAALAESTDIISIIVMSILLGMSKSATVLNNSLTISGYCRPEKLPGGLGLNMISKGVLVVTVGQFLGWIRDFTDSYVLCLHVQNIFLLLVVLVWTPEIYYHFRQQRKAETNTSSAQANKEKEAEIKPAELVKLNA